MRVCGPSVFLALRAVGRNAVQVAAIGLHGGIPNFVKQCIGAFEIACRLYVRMHEQSGEALGCERNRFGANHFDVLETMIRKGGDINLLLAVSAQGVLVGLQYLSFFHTSGLIPALWAAAGRQ